MTTVMRTNACAHCLKLEMKEFHYLIISSTGLTGYHLKNKIYNNWFPEFNSVTNVFGRQNINKKTKQTKTKQKTLGKFKGMRSVNKYLLKRLTRITNTFPVHLHFLNVYNVVQKHVH